MEAPSARSVICIDEFACALAGDVREEPRRLLPPTAGEGRASERLPEAAQQLLRELDVDGSGEVTEQGLIHALQVAQKMKAILDDQGHGGTTRQKLTAGLGLLRALDHLTSAFDKDNSGQLSADELKVAADAYRRLAQRGRWLQVIIILLAGFLIVTLAGVFGLSLLAYQLSKDTHLAADGVMVGRDGSPVLVGNSDFMLQPDGSLIPRQLGTNCSRGEQCTAPANGSLAGLVKVATAEVRRRLSSTLPDSAFQQLKSLTLKGGAGHTMKVTITAFQRVFVRSSACGSLVHLLSAYGRLTLDDYAMSVDAQMEQYITASGLGSLFQGGTLAGFGRRLDDAGGLLEGFFNMLANVTWKCESAPLPSPMELSHDYHAKVLIKERVATASVLTSRLFTSSDGVPLMLAGAEAENGAVFKTWTQDLVHAGSTVAKLNSYAMNPYCNELSVTYGAATLTMQTSDAVGYRCVVGRATKSASLVGDGPAHPQFMGIATEGGVVLRWWRFVLLDLDATGAPTNNASLLMRVGLMPNVIEYWDVDSDPTAARVPGQPYRFRAYSTAPGATASLELQYLSVRSLPSTLALRDVMQLLNVTALGGPCLEESNTTDGQRVVRDLAFLGVLNASTPFELHPWSEVEQSIAAVVERYNRQGSTADLTWMVGSPYWSAVFGVARNFAIVDAYLLAHGGARRLQVQDLPCLWILTTSTTTAGGSFLGVKWTSSPSSFNLNAWDVFQLELSGKSLVVAGSGSMNLAPRSIPLDIKFDGALTFDWSNTPRASGELNVVISLSFCPPVPNIACDLIRLPSLSIQLRAAADRQSVSLSGRAVIDLWRVDVEGELSVTYNLISHRVSFCFTCGVHYNLWIISGSPSWPICFG